MYTDLKMLDLFERIFAHVKPGAEDDEHLAEGRVEMEKLRKQVAENMCEQLSILEECCGDVTPAPWCAFSDDEKIWAIMAAGRPGDVFKFEEPPKEADAHYILLAQPHYIKVMIQRIRHLETQAGIEKERRWTKEKDDGHEKKRR